MSNRIDISHLPTSGKLEMLASVVEKCQQFDMGVWATDENLTFEELCMVPVGKCDTAACALGTAATVFEGLQLVDTGGRVVVTSSNYGPDSSTAVGAEFFGISLKEAIQLFAPHTYGLLGEYFSHQIPKSMVLARIRELANDYRKRGQ